jgi:hypothetical protein
MKRNFLLIVSLSCAFSSNLFAENKLSLDLTLDHLQFQKPLKGVGRAGLMNFKYANITNNGIVLNINNENSFFNSQIFLRPTFLGFTTQFGNYGLTIEDETMFNLVDSLELKNSKLILDDNQLNLAGEYFKFINPDMDLLLNNFRLYCQSPIVMSEVTPSTTPPPAADMIKICSTYMTLNGTYNAVNNGPALLFYKGKDKLTGDKTDIQAKVKNIDIRASQIFLNFNSIKTISNDSYIINANDLNIVCAKDPDATKMKQDKITKDCLNSIKIKPLKASLIDNKTKTNFNLDIKDITIKDKIVYLTMNSASLADPKSTTHLSGLILNCKKELDTDLMDVMSVIRDCVSYGRASISEVKSTKADEDKSSSVKKIAVSSTANIMSLQADIKLFGLTTRVSIHGNLNLNESKKQVILSVTDTRLPLGFTSVKVLMYFLKKNFISKDIAYVNNNIIISL